MGEIIDLMKQVRAVNQANGFDTPADIGLEPWHVAGKLALIHSEVSEALEALREEDAEDAFTEELADVCIRVFDLAEGLRLDLGGAIWDKLEKNKTRGYMHGGKRL